MGELASGDRRPCGWVIERCRCCQ